MSAITYRRLHKADAERFRALRLEALANAPTAFGSDYADHANLPLAHFAERIQTTDENFILAAEVVGELVGMAGFVREAGTKRRHMGMIWGMYVQPSHRGRGTGRGLLEGVLTAATSLAGLEFVELSVTVGNTSAEALYRSIGFETYGVESNALKIGDRYYDEANMQLDLRAWQSRR